MRVELIYSRKDWNVVLNACRETSNMEDTTKEPSTRWKYNLLLAEHSPIRLLQITIRVYGVKSWVATHFCRHHIGVEKFVSTQRDDRTGKNRDEARQDTLVNLELDMNAQAIINISRKRLCRQAHKETTAVWKAILEEVRKELPELVDICVPECIYRGFCPEMKSCGYCTSENYVKEVVRYRNRLKKKPIDVDAIFNALNDFDDSWMK